MNHHKTRTAAWLLAACLGASSLACRAPAGSQNSYSGTEIGDMQRVEGNVQLKQNLWVSNPRKRRVDGRLQIQFDLENRRATNLRFAWAAIWFDKDGFQIDDGARHWEPVQLNGRGTKTLTVTSPTREAVSWRLDITSPNEVQ